MTRQEVIIRIKELEDICRQAQSNQELYEALLKDYSVQVWALRSINDTYPWERAIEVQELREDMEVLSTITDEEFGEYIHLGNLLAILLYPIEEVKYEI